MHMRAVHPDVDTHTTCRPIDLAPMQEAKESMRRIRAELTPSRDERNVEDVLYWLEKARDAVSDVAGDYYELDSPLNEALLDAESAVEDLIYEYRQAWESSKAREASDLMDDDRR